MDLLNLTGKKYLITGASSGIGQATAILISQLGGKVVLSGRNEDKLNQTMAQMDGEGHYIMPFDLINLDGINSFVNACVKIDGLPFDGLVFAAGIVNIRPIRIESIDNLLSELQVNFLSYFAMVKALGVRKNMKDGGSIVAISSISAIKAPKGSAGYATSKAAMDIASDVAALELSKRKIRINTIRPCMTNTPMTTYFFENPDVKQRLDELYPLGVLTPRDVADSAVFLLSDLSKKITGEHISITAGANS